MNITTVKEKLSGSKFFKDSFWAVFGNGIGNALLLLAGIIIARFLGKDVYGEYGMVKSTMFYIASFATFGLGFTSTRYISASMEEHKEHILSIVRTSLSIALAFSCFIALSLFVFAKPLSEYLEQADMEMGFKYLAGVIVFRALTTTQIGILAGFKDFKVIARNSLLSGIVMLLLCAPLTYFFGLTGSLLSLFLSQLFNTAINYFSIRVYTSQLVDQVSAPYFKELVSFSFPVALQECSFTICNCVAIIVLTKYSSVGELGLYSAAAQWGAIITMIPTLLSNVVLSYLSGTIKDKKQHARSVSQMFLINLACVFLPFLVICVLAGFISSFYGATFAAMPNVLRVLTFVSVIEACSSVFKSELMAQAKTWILFFLRCLRDVGLVSLVLLFLYLTHGENGAIMFSWASVIASVVFLIAIYFSYIILILKKN